MSDVNIILNKIKHLYDLSTDTELAKTLEVRPNTISTWRIRGEVPYKKIFSFCEQKKINPLHFFHEKNNDESSELLMILKRIKSCSERKYNIIRDLIVELDGQLHEPETRLKSCVKGIGPEPVCMHCKEKLIRFEFSDLPGEYTLICKKCNIKDQEQIKLIEKELKNKRR